MANFNQNGIASYTTGEAIDQNLSVKFNSSGNVVKTGAGEVGIGITEDNYASGAQAAVRLHNAPGERKITMASTCSIDDLLYPAAAGTFSTTGAGSAVFRALEAASGSGSRIRAVPLPAAEVGGRFPFGLMDWVDPDGTDMAASAGAGVFGRVAGTHGTGTVTLISEAANNNSKTDKARLIFTVPDWYVPGTDILVTINAVEDTALTVDSTVDFEAYKGDGAGGVSGADLIATAAQSISDSAADYTFTLTGTSLSPGDLVDLELTVVANDTGGAVNENVTIYSITLQQKTS